MKASDREWSDPHATRAKFTTASMIRRGTLLSRLGHRCRHHETVGWFLDLGRFPDCPHRSARPDSPAIIRCCCNPIATKFEPMNRAVTNNRFISVIPQHHKRLTPCVSARQHARSFVYRVLNRPSAPPGLDKRSSGIALCAAPYGNPVCAPFQMATAEIVPGATPSLVKWNSLAHPAAQVQATRQQYHRSNSAIQSYRRPRAILALGRQNAHV